jgi:ubiquinone/menaquinone biosynthesis C-methylase UbiE
VTQDESLLESELLEQRSEDLAASEYNMRYHSPPIYKKHSEDFAYFLAQHIQAGDRILDLGCASASLWKFLLPLLPDNVTLTGADLSPNMLDIARKSYPEHQFILSSFRSLPFDDISFDVVIVSSAFHHISDKMLPQALNEILRVLEEHGKLLGREPLHSDRFIDRGGYTSGALMALRHLFYLATNTKELPEPDPGPDHHAYNPKEFIDIINTKLKVTSFEFRNPISPIFGRIENTYIAKYADYLDRLLKHREGSEIWYASQKSFSDLNMLNDVIINALQENHLSNSEIQTLLAVVRQITPEILDTIND